MCIVTRQCDIFHHRCAEGTLGAQSNALSSAGASGKASEMTPELREIYEEVEVGQKGRAGEAIPAQGTASPL